MENNYIYDGKFSGNILIVGGTECGKTSFVQKLALNNFFGKLKKTESVSGIELSKQEKQKLRQIFLVKLVFIIHRMRMNSAINLINLN